VVQSILLWSDTAFLGQLAACRGAEHGPALLKPQIADLIRAAYDPVLPARRHRSRPRAAPCRPPVPRAQ
jgi:hypothetical protein